MQDSYVVYFFFKRRSKSYSQNSLFLSRHKGNRNDRLFYRKNPPISNGKSPNGKSRTIFNGIYLKTRHRKTNPDTIYTRQAAYKGRLTKEKPTGQEKKRTNKQRTSGEDRPG